MGSEQSKSPPELGLDVNDDRYIELKKCLIRDGKFALDFNSFVKLITSSYERLPSILCECLYLGFAQSIKNKVDVIDFVAIVKSFCEKNRSKMVRFMFHVYDVRSANMIDRGSVEGVLKTVYGKRHGENQYTLHGISPQNEKDASFILDDLFRTNAGLSLSEFEKYEGSLDIMSDWIRKVLCSILEQPSPQILQIERKYSSSVEPEEVMSRFNISKAKCDKLRALFYSHCGAQKHELRLSQWMQLCGSYLSPNLASALFKAKSRGFKNIWRFTDFADFCLVNGAGTVDDQALALCKTFYLGHKARSRNLDSIEFKGDNSTRELDLFLREMRTMILLLAQVHNERLTKNATFSANFSTSPPTHSQSGSNDEDLNIEVDVGVEEVPLESLEENIYISQEIQAALAHIEEHALKGSDHPSVLVQYYVELLIKHHSNLPGIRELSITACCLFGIRPTSPHLEKDFVMEIMVRRQAIAPQTSMNPFGPLNTEWCIISKEWWDSWRYFVGKMRHRTADNSTLETDPGKISNESILKNTGTNQLLSHMRTGKHLEVIPPAVYAAVTSWYGGGPKVMRKVVPAKNGTTELELFPVVINVCTCDHSGKRRLDEKEYLFSKSATISEVMQELCESKSLEVGKVRLWNYAESKWRDQYIISPEITIETAALKDDQLILIEISTQNGTWPRSQLHTSLQEEADAGETDESVTSLNGKSVVKLNSGKIGLDNLGNTCYMNASLQALLHTEHLMDFFLSQIHMQHINVSNKHGHGGRLAYFFGRLANEVWTSPQRSISPRAFCGEVGSLNAQFAGHQQQDAQELLDFLLVGLSEDLNLVQDKPYIEMPDSDGRPDSELANIWWENHQKRDLSIITSLFSGQFKSSTVCACGHNSARYEPFTLLSVAIPENAYRNMSLHVFTRGVSYGVHCRVGVPRASALQDLVNAIFHRDYKPAIVGAATIPLFVAVEVVSSRIKQFYAMDQRLATISDLENIFLFEVARLPDEIVDSATENVTENDSSEKPDNIGDETQSNGLAESGLVSKVEPFEGGRQLTSNPPSSNLICAPLNEVRVAFAHRKMRPFDSGGLEYFQLAVFGLPLLEVLPQKCSGASLYSIIQKRVEPYLRGRVDQLRGYSLFSETIEQENAENSRFDTGSVRPMRDEEAVSRQIPPMGYVLRCISGGDQAACSCSRCPWLSQCRGCFIPQNDEEIELLDGQTIAIDWHMIVFEEMIDNTAIMKVQVHPSAGHARGAYERRIPLSRCLEKFTENERLEGFTCGKCKTDESMKRNFKLWRLPPVLVIQIKRFQFDHTSRRKLNNHIEFPLNGLDVESYLADTRKTPKSKGTDTQKSKSISAFRAEIDSAVGKARIDGATTGTLDGLPLTEESDVGCTLYDLYAVVHHIGALGGGHYVTTVRESRKPRIDGSISKSVSKTEIQGMETESVSTTESESHGWSDRWWLFNDGQVTPLHDNSEVSAASAYVLFYMRRDAQEMSKTDLFPQGQAFSVDRTNEFLPKFRSSRPKGFNERLQEVGRSGANAFRRMTGAKIPDENEDTKAKRESKSDCSIN